MSYIAKHLLERCRPSNSALLFVSKRAVPGRSAIRNNHAVRYHFTSTLIETTCNQRFHMNVTGHISQTDLQLSQRTQIRTFKNVAEYHTIADDTLHNIQDALEELIEDNFVSLRDDDDLPEVNYANGVLTISLPPHGTWVINKQTPNEQLWWSSPISGPRRYEYVEERERWVYTRVIDEESGASTDQGEAGTLGEILAQEIKKLYDCDLELEA